MTVSRGGALADSIGGKASGERAEPYTPQCDARGPKKSHVDVRSIVAPAAERLTAKALAPGAGVASLDSYVRGVRKNLADGKALPFLMRLAIAYDDIWNRGKSAAEVTAPEQEFCAMVERWESERNGQRSVVADLPITPLAQRANRESSERDRAAMLCAERETPENLARLERETIEADVAGELLLDTVRAKQVAMADAR